jgi:two-component system OmpR family response regulator
MPTPHRILVVDDEPDTLGLVQLTLETAGFKADTAGSGGEALLLAQKQPYDLILLDVMMPDMSGFDVFARMKTSMTSVPPVVFLTAKNRPEDRETGEGIGAVAYLIKPITRGQLLDVLHRTLGIDR